MPDYFVWLDGVANDPVERLAVSTAVGESLSAVFDEGIETLLGSQELIPLSNEPFQPDETEAWIIEDFQVPDVLAAAVGNPIGVPRVGREIESARVKCIIGSALGPDDDVVAFQVLDRRQVISSRGLSIILDGNTFKSIEDPGLLLGDDVHAVLVGDRLVFRSLWWARRIFDLESYYVEATRDQIDAFAGRDDVAIRDEDFAETATQWERKRISYLVQSGLMDQTTPSDVQEKAADYDIAVELDDEDGGERLVIPKDSKERRKLLKFLEEDYYHGPLTDEKYVANSKRKVGA